MLPSGSTSKRSTKKSGMPVLYELKSRTSCPAPSNWPTALGVPIHTSVPSGAGAMLNTWFRPVIHTEKDCPKSVLLRIVPFQSPR